MKTRQGARDQWNQQMRTAQEKQRKEQCPLMPVGENRLKVASLRNNHPEWTLQQIADEVGISRERVRQLLVKLGLPTKRQLN